ncbi:Hypothetical protein SCF082_LOCUS33806 [Durusdinium trenchii]|uniref:Uncharacterized protein n=1 Tax=Durusdinium trenchii TaxID=1381693 RepID=A0ABP0NT73_9DINO
MLQMRRPPRRRSADFFPTAEVSERRSRPGEPVEATEVLGSLLATGVGALMVAQSSGGAVGMACIPFVSWSEGSLREAMSEAPEEVTRRLRLLAHLVNGAALAQLGTAMLQFILNDPLSGLIGGGIAAIGCQTAHPAGFRLLPTYVVLSFCHGIMQVLLNLQLFASGVPLHAMTSVRAGLMGKLAVGTLVASPLVMFLGMGMGYCLHKEFQQVLHASTPVPAAPAPLPATPAPAPGNDAPGSTSRPLPAEERAAPKAAPKAELTALEHAGIGASVGSIEMAIMRPAVFWKTELQQQRFSLSRAINPSYCYRGLPLAIASIAPITCIQFGANSLISSGIKATKGASELRESERLGVAVVAGAASALVQCPCQLVEVNQSNHGSSMFSTARRVVSEYGFLGLYRGYSMGATREGIFCSSYMAVNPMVKSWVQEQRLELSDAAATLAASASWIWERMGRCRYDLESQQRSGAPSRRVQLVTSIVKKGGGYAGVEGMDNSTL